MSTPSRVMEPQQDRSRESLERVMEAGFEVLAEDGWRGLTLAKVCERAGVSVGIIYRRFHGRDDLLVALQDRWIDGAAQGARELEELDLATADLPATEVVTAAVRAFVGKMEGAERATHVLGLHGFVDDQGIERLRDVSHAYAAWFRGCLRPHLGHVAHRDPERAVDFAFRIVLDTTIRRATHGEDFDTGTTVGDWDAFATELALVAIAYLFGDIRPEQ